MKQPIILTGHRKDTLTRTGRFATWLERLLRARPPTAPTPTLIGFAVFVAATALLAAAPAAQAPAPTIVRAIMVVLCALTAAAAIVTARRPSRIAVTLMTLGVLLLIGVLRRLVLGPDPFPARSALAGALIAGVWALIALVLALIVHSRAREVFLACGVTAVLLFAAELWFSRIRDLAIPAIPHWEGLSLPDSELQFMNPPNAVNRNYYRHDPRHDFEHNDTRADRWNLHLTAPAAATLTPLDTAWNSVRAHVTRSDSSVPWLVQLHYGPLPLTATGEYGIGFRVRADRSRSIGFSLARSHEPWGPIGTPGFRTVGPEWQEVRLPVDIAETDSAATLAFMLGDALGDVDVDQVVLLGPTDTVRPSLQQRFFVSYRFNDHGCRGPDYAIPAPPNTVRVLTLGDSYTLGVGVREEQTVQAQLARLLAARDTSHRYEVLNCGVSGYATWQERGLYDRIHYRYGASVVVLLMVFNDERSFVDDLRLGYMRPLSRAERLFRLWRLIAYTYYRRPMPDFHPVMQDVLRLDSSVAAHGGRLVVAVFRNNPMVRDWKALVETANQELPPHNVPVLDLGPSVLAAAPDTLAVAVPGEDGHPSPAAHRAAAAALLAELERRHLLPPPTSRR